MDREKENMHLNASSLIFERARELRTKTTKVEKILWEELREKKVMGYKFRRQHPILKFILDFYCHSLKLGIELDGDSHDINAQKFYDKDRTEILSEFGIKVLRFQNEEVTDNLKGVLEKIKNEIKSSATPTPKGETNSSTAQQLT